MVMAVPLLELLASLTGSLASANTCLPSSPEILLPPTHGISLLDARNDLLLSYLEHVVFLILVKIRQEETQVKSDGDLSGPLSEPIRRLVELRAHLEKGVRPLQSRLKYQIEKVLRSADDADRAPSKHARRSRIHSKDQTNSLEGESGESGESGDSSDSSTLSADNAPPSGSTPHIDNLSYRPMPSDLLLKTDSSSQPAANNDTNPSTLGVYRPPRITPTTAPDHRSTAQSRSERRQRKSHILDEYISTELSSAPVAQPSIGSNSTILDRGRSALSRRERDSERQRTEYEESNFSRLPKASRAETKENRTQGADEHKDRFGGEDWSGLGAVGDRVARSVGSRANGRNGGTNVVERREKRKREARDEAGVAGRMNGGARIGESFEKKKRRFGS
jgi:U3 small nucleolar ribonucleoprotein protein LCP5